ncbi:MAG: hypothetical protein DMG57_18620 [Acidobacteria bacterium]|nr:MAG: hypothetical protein DMG57_18620 [Acidobacteriota bacterium]
MKVIFESLNGASGSVLVGVLNSLWQAVAVALVAWLALKLTPRINAATRFVVWWAVLAVITVLPIAGRLTTVWQPRPEAVVSAPMVSAQSSDLSVAARPIAATPTTISRAALLPIELHVATWPLWIFTAWLVTFLYQIARIVCSYRYLQGVKRRSRPPTRELQLNFDEWVLACHVRRPVRLLLSNEIASPMAVGFLQPAVILPEPLLDQFTAPELDHILLHELAHMARRDDWTNLMARFITAVVGLHPVAAWVLRRIEAEREIASDDWVVAMTGAARPYATMLARLFEICRARRQELLASGMANGASHLGARIEMLLRSGREFAPKASLMRVALSAIILLAFAMASSHIPRWIAFAQEPLPPAPPEPSALQAEPQPPKAPAGPKKAKRQPRNPQPAALTEPPETAQPPLPSEPLIAEPPTAVEPAVAPPALVQPATSYPAIVQPAAPVEPVALVAAPQSPAPPQPYGRGSLLAALVAFGYGNLSVDEIIDLKNSGVSAEFIAGMSHAGWGKLTPKQLIDLHIQGVSPEYAEKVREAGLKNLGLKEVIEMRIHGVRPEHMREIHSLGFGPYTPKQAIDFAINGVQPDLFRALKEAGFAHLDPGEIIEAKINGVRAESLREAKTYGPNLTLKQIIRLKKAGVI